MSTPVDNLIDYLEYRKACGEKTVDLEEETVAALAAFAKGAPPPTPHSPPPTPHSPPPTPSPLPTPHFSLPTSPPSPAPGPALRDFVFVGEQEGIVADKAKYSETFRKMVAAMGYGKDEALFSNICIGRRAETPPSPQELSAALPAFREFLAKAKPRGLVILGSTAARGLLGKQDISSIHGRVFRFDGLPAIPTYHPAYMVKFPAVKRDACRDLCNALKAIERPVTKALAPYQ